MRTAAIGLFICSGLVIAAAGAPPLNRQARGQRPAGPNAIQQTATDQLVTIAFAGVSSQGQTRITDQVTIIDPSSRVLCVYHIDRESGAVTLKSVRNIHWDLRMDEFNSVSPSPSEIRSLLQPR